MTEADPLRCERRESPSENARLLVLPAARQPVP